MHVKTVKVTNPKNVVVQVPGFIASKWALSERDELEVHISDDEQAVVIRPKKVRPGSNINKEGKGLVGGPRGYSLLQSIR